MARDPYRGPRATPATRPAVSEPRVREDEPTLVQCSICAGCGMVTQEVAAMVDKMIEREKGSVE